MGPREVLVEEEELQQDGDEAGTRIRNLILGPSSDTPELGCLRSCEPYSQWALVCRLTRCRTSQIRKRSRQSKANPVAERYRFTISAMLLQLMELSRIPLSVKHAFVCSTG